MLFYCWYTTSINEKLMRSISGKYIVLKKELQKRENNAFTIPEKTYFCTAVFYY